MTVFKETPRIQTFIAVRVGGKNDPWKQPDSPHYFEHLMFGVLKFGTQNYAAEKPLLDAIEQQFEVYRKTKDEAKISITQSTVCHTRLQNTLYLMSTTN